MTQPYFASLLPELASRAARATVSRLGFSNAPLRGHLMDVFSRGFGERGAFLGEPVFEATFGWQSASQPMSSLAGTLLHPELIAAMDEPPGGKNSEYRFAKDASPYEHQIAAWQYLLAPQAQSVVVTSGTGSGKTECFMVPILNRLVTEHLQRRAKLVGVRALFLYPLNALIQSQRERLNAWTSRFDDGVRFCLYNGLTPNKVKQEQRDKSPNEVVDREVLRAAPPPVLVTNPTMLEYMLVRAQDAPILDASKGKLEWVVLDEAHTYIGSQAAELALLLRRVLHAFDVKADNVRFVATSATIGGEPGKSAEELRGFIAKLAGVSVDRVHVVSGARSIPALPNIAAGSNDLSLEQLEAIDEGRPESRYAALCNHRRARVVRELFIPSQGGAAANTLDQIAAAILDRASPVTVTQDLETLRWLDVLTSARSSPDGAGKPFLPLRLHAFHNVLAGLWACSDAACRCKTNTRLDHVDWPYGLVYMEERRHCECGAPVYDLRSCNDCNSTYLWARRVHRQQDGRYRLLPVAENNVDEFTLDVEAEEEDGIPDDGETSSDPVLIANGRHGGTAEVLVERSTCLLDPPNETDTIRLRLKDQTHTDDGWQMVCPECGGHHAIADRMFRRAVLGAPFLLGEVIPTLLEYCPDGEDPNSRPMRGRRMITFTDSRQGTARIAAKLQQDSERNRVRGAVYLKTLDSARGADPAAVAAIDAQIAALAGISGNPVIAAMLEQKRVERDALLKPKPVPFGDLVQWLSATVPDVRDWMHRFYSGLDPAQFEGPSGKDRLAKILVMREFARRPTRLNSLETMGLVAVQYPKLDTLVLRPVAVENAGLTLQEWKSFLKVALDFFVRANTFIELPDSWRKWGGNRIASKLLLNPESIEKQTSRLKRWPQCNAGFGQNRLVRMLAYVLNLDSKSDVGRDHIDSILRAGWDDLVKIDLLRAGGNGRFLSLEDTAFAPITAAWVCPVTRRILDTTFRGVTPYLPSSAVTPAVAECRAIEIPLSYLSKGASFVSDAERVNAIRGWADGNETVRALRTDGLWSDLSDRIIEGGAYFRSVEHSAQQSGARLQEYEREFKEGYLNLLNCSTTMEMGVDIGGINMVAMNNVPPHPANYLQRAGRAGRRGETRSVALTLCKNNPHDQQVFSNTMWAFLTRLPAPSISLSSPVLVQRHVNAMLLSDFLRSEVARASLDKLDMDWWMLPRDASRLDRFAARANCFEERNHPELSIGLTSLLRHTVFEDQPALARLAAASADAAKAHGARWAAEYDSIEAQLQLFTAAGKEKDPAYKSLQIQKKRLTGEYLLRDLASGGFLPGYGFPTNITSFDTLNKDEIERVKFDQDRTDGGNRRRVDNLLRRRELPSRDSVTALREYAPGAEIVIDGLVYRSSGITLNWHAPASSQDASEIQNIRAAWRCRSCGSSGTNVLAESLTNCLDCGAELHSDTLSRFKYLEPAGFAVDLYEPTHNDVSVQTYVPVEAPWINASGDWLPLPNPTLGRFRASSLGTVFHHSAGAYGMGFAVCLECGRSEPMASDPPGGAAPAGSNTPPVFRRPHRRLRGAQGGDTKLCAGSDRPFSIQSALRFGCESTTDVLELVLSGLDGRPLSDRKVAYSIAVAIRGAVAATLGVEESEIGCDTKEIRVSSGERAQALLVFDRSGSGYSSSVTPGLVEVLRRARDMLQCGHSCNAACQHCLLSFDTRFRVDDLDRHAALSFLTERWLDELSLKEGDSHFGIGRSFAEYQSLPESITREFTQAKAHELRIYLSGKHDDWDLPGSTLRKWIHRWSLEGKQIRLLVPASIANEITAEERFALKVLKSYGNVDVYVGAAPPCLTGAVTLATIVGAAAPHRSWAIQLASAAAPTAEWGDASSIPLVMGYSDSGQVGAPLDLPDATPQGNGEQSIRVEINSELDGQADGFGRRLLERLLAALPGGRLPGVSAVQAITYQDRYLSSPLPTMLLVDLISALKAKCLDDDRWDLDRVQVVTSPLDATTTGYGNPVRVSHNWASTQLRNDVLVAAFEYSGIGCDLVCIDRRDTEHARCMGIQMSDGTGLSIWFDQGFGYWTVPRGDGRWERAGVLNFPFLGSIHQQAEAIASPNVVVAGQRFATHLFMSMK